VSNVGRIHANQMNIALIKVAVIVPNPGLGVSRRNTLRNR
jgi:hypothetical protein